MKKLVEQVKKELNVPYLTEDDTLCDGCFCVTPILSSGIRGNGVVQHMNTAQALDIFYADKMELVEKAQALAITLSKNGYVCQDLSYTHEKNVRLWRANTYITGKGGN